MTSVRIRSPGWGGFFIGIQGLLTESRLSQLEYEELVIGRSNLSPEIENRVKDELAAGQYRDLNRFVGTAVQYFRRSTPAQSAAA